MFPTRSHGLDESVKRKFRHNFPILSCGITMEPTSTLTTSHGRGCGRGFPNNCNLSVKFLQDCPKDSPWKAHPNQVWPGFQMLERQNQIQNKFNFLKTHFRRKGLSKSFGFKSPTYRASATAASAHNISRGSSDTYSMEMSMQSHNTQQPSTASPSVVSQHSTVD